MWNSIYVTRKTGQNHNLLINFLLKISIDFLTQLDKAQTSYRFFRIGSDITFHLSLCNSTITALLTAPALFPGMHHSPLWLHDSAGLFPLRLGMPVGKLSSWHTPINLSSDSWISPALTLMSPQKFLCFLICSIWDLPCYFSIICMVISHYYHYYNVNFVSNYLSFPLTLNSYSMGIASC